MTGRKQLFYVYEEPMVSPSCHGQTDTTITNFADTEVMAFVLWQQTEELPQLFSPGDSLWSSLVFCYIPAQKHTVTH